MRQELNADEWDQVFGGPPKPKMLSLVELIEQAKKSRKEES